MDIGSTRIPELEALTMEIALAKFPVEYIPKLTTFYEERQEHPDYENIKFTCEMWITMTYSSHGMYTEAFEIELRHLKELSFESRSFSTVVNSAINSSETLNRNDEIVSYVLGFITPMNQDFYGRIFLIDWYIRNYSLEDNGSAELIQAVINDMALGMAEVSHDPSAPLKKQVSHLLKELKRASKAVGLFKLDYRDAPEDDKQNILENYLADESIIHFKNEAKRTFGLE